MWLNIRFIAFLGTLLLLIPLRKSPPSRLNRWTSNLGLSALSNMLVFFLVPILPYFLAIQLQESGVGLLNIIEVPYVLSFIVTVLIFDFVIYLQHMAFHYIPWAWKLHRVHHTDLKLDATTGIRFHPIEIILSVFIKLGIVLVLGPTPESILFFEILLNGTSLFNHSNINLPQRLDSFLRRFIVTPNMHSVHHSVIPAETNSNFGFNFPWWDWVFKTYKKQQEHGPKDYTVGLNEFRDSKKLTFLKLLKLPFIRGKR
ncbi:MAG: sterol desaturase family protein [bacterium]|nr:sterol desaturase family protein [bacterium]